MSSGVGRLLLYRYGMAPHRGHFWTWAVSLALMTGATGACQGPPSGSPSIEFTTVPEAGAGGSDRVAPITGRVTGARDDQQIVLFAKSGVWWVQPLTIKPFTPIDADSTFRNTTHLGTEYAALLVEPDYRPPATVDVLPKVGGRVVAVAAVKGKGDFVERPRRTLAFSGYEWELRAIPSDRGGANEYDPDNAWTDDEGLLHLRLASRGGRWTSVEVINTRSLGYGTYSFVVRDTSQLDPAAALGMLTWDEQGADQNHRELDIEISQWGVKTVNNAQYVVQPYYVPANVSRFAAPPGLLTHTFRWEPGRVLFKTMRGAVLGTSAAALAEHEFTAGIPVPGTERVRMNLYFFRYSAEPPKRDVEVVIERFQYLP
jgi:hypothetical protein